MITVLFLVVASLLVSGCTTSTTSSANLTPSTTPSTTTHDAFLENYLAEYKNQTDMNLSVKAWELTWLDSTSARLELTTLNKTTNVTVNAVQTFIVFPMTLDATNYLNAMNKTAFSLTSTGYERGSRETYLKALDHAPQVYKEYVDSEGSPLNLSEYKLHRIEQADNLVIVTTQKVLS